MLIMHLPMADSQSKRDRMNSSGTGQATNCHLMHALHVILHKRLLEYEPAAESGELQWSS